jgi:biotin transport system substrate-specific component
MEPKRITASKWDVYQLTKIALCVALVCVSAFLSFPLPFTPIVISAQTIFINLLALILTPRQSVAAILVYILLGACGLPVFSGGVGGLQKLVGPSGGYLIGFVAAVFLISLFKGKKASFWRYLLVTLCVGLPVIDLFAFLYGWLVLGWAAETAFASLVVPFLIGDAIKCVIASYLAKILKQCLKNTKMAIE